TVAEADGGVATLSYPGGLLATVAEPGGRTVTVTHTGSDLTGVTNPDGGQATFGYDTSHRMTSWQFGPLNATYGYDTGTGTLATATLDTGSAVTVSPAAVQGLATNPARSLSQAGGVLTDAP